MKERCALFQVERSGETSVCFCFVLKSHVVSKITILPAGKTKLPTTIRELVMPDNDNRLSGGDGFNNGGSDGDTIQDILACELRTNLNIWTQFGLGCSFWKLYFLCKVMKVLSNQFQEEHA